MRVGITAYPASAVKIHDRRKRAGGTSRPDDPNWHGTRGSRRQSQVLDVRARPADRSRLHPGQSGARQIRGQAFDRWFIGDRVDKLLGLRLDEGFDRVSPDVIGARPNGLEQVPDIYRTE